MKTRARLTIWWALRTVERRGLTGKLDAKEGERDGKGVPVPTQLSVWGTSYISSSSGSGMESQQKTYLVKFELENAYDNKDFGNF